jgi:DNA polymerase-3 subunit epsilon
MINHPNIIDRDRSIIWARAMLDRPFLIVDTETTGLLRDRQTRDVTPAEIVQIGILSSGGDVLMDELVRPQQPIPASATAIHNITDEDVENCRQFHQLWPRIDRILYGQTIAIYNLQYDRGLIGRHLVDIYGDPADAVNWVGGCKWQCAMMRYSAFVGEMGFNDYRWQKLPDCGKGRAHSAIGDCWSTLQIIKDMAAASLSTEEVAACAA